MSVFDRQDPVQDRQVNWALHVPPGQFDDRLSPQRMRRRGVHLDQGMSGTPMYMFRFYPWGIQSKYNLAYKLRFGKMNHFFLLKCFVYILFNKKRKRKNQHLNTESNTNPSKGCILLFYTTALQMLFGRFEKTD